MKKSNILKGGVEAMKKEYDFSKAVQGKFYRPIEKLELNKVINTILRKEMEMLKTIGV